MSNKGTGAVTGEQDQMGGPVPKLRFPEFRDAQAWQTVALKDVLRPTSREVAKPESSYTGLGLRSHGKGTFQKADQDPDKIAMDRLYVVHRDDLIVNITFAWEGAIAIANDSDHGLYVSHRFPTYEFKSGVSSPDFFRYVITDKAFVYRLGVISPGGAGRNRVMNKNDLLRISTLLPSVSEQQKIADCLSSIDTLIAAEAEKLEALKDHKKGLMQQLFPAPGETTPRLRFPEFQDAGDWQWKQLGEILATITPPKKLPTSAYQQQGQFPIIDQGQNLIAGWTDDLESVLRQPLPVVAFGDHTCALKFVDFPFAQGADGLKIIQPNGKMTVEYLFNALQAYPVNSGEYKRHFLDLKEKLVAYPVKTGEQQAIVNSLSSIDARIVAQGDKIDALKAHKTGLMQQLFPVASEVQA
jgi:type I restriction enzyme S subunit